MTKICSLILEVRQTYGTRRGQALRTLSRWSSFRARMKRSRQIKMSSRKMMKLRLVGSLRKGDRKDIRKLDEAVKINEEDIDRAFKMLKEATRYIDDLVRDPRRRRGVMYKKWERALDSFLSEMRSMVEYKRYPGHYELDLLDLLIARLNHMRISEMVGEQTAIRFSLQDVVKTLFSVTRDQRSRMIGM